MIQYKTTEHILRSFFDQSTAINLLIVAQYAEKGDYKNIAKVLVSMTVLPWPCLSLQTTSSLVVLQYYDMTATEECPNHCCTTFACMACRPSNKSNLWVITTIVKRGFCTCYFKLHHLLCRSKLRWSPSGIHHNHPVLKGLST